jgi:hypothetical protein
MNRTYWWRRAGVGAALVLTIVAAIARGQEQPKKTYPYPEVRDMRGVVPTGPEGRSL